MIAWGHSNNKRTKNSGILLPNLVIAVCCFSVCLLCLFTPFLSNDVTRREWKAWCEFIKINFRMTTVTSARKIEGEASGELLTGKNSNYARFPHKSSTIWRASRPKGRTLWQHYRCDEQGAGDVANRATFVIVAANPDRERYNVAGRLIIAEILGENATNNLTIRLLLLVPNKVESSVELILN